MPTLLCPGCGKTVRFEGVAGVCPNCAAVVRVAKPAPPVNVAPPTGPKPERPRPGAASVTDLESLENGGEEFFAPSAAPVHSSGSFLDDIDKRLLFGIG